MSDNALQISSLYANIGKFSLTDINIKLKKGTITGFVGKNGAGKTSLIKTLVDIIPKAKGEVLFFDKPLYKNEKEIKPRLGIVFDKLIYAQNVKAYTVMTTISPFYPNWSTRKFNELMEKFELDKSEKLNHYSKGMQMKFSIVLALSHNPDLLILDEPTSGLDPVARIQVLDLLYDIIQDEEKTIFFSTHITSDLDKIADSIIMIEKGEILFSEEKDKMLETNFLVHIDKEAMNDEIKALFIGLKENSFGFVGLISDRENLTLIPNAKITKPTVEDIMIYRGEM
ncbi:MAG TPA: ABC transporter ATP-binding protein [Clostridiaceae bacterium]